LRVKAIRFGAKTKKFDLNDMKTFEEIYKDVENSCAVLRDINDLVQKQEIAELLTGFENLDPDFTDSRLSIKTAIYEEKPLRQ
jgi:hypothetical protein